MSDAASGVIERMFEHLGVRDWDAFGAVLSTEVERIGQFGDRVVGRDAYVHFMAGEDTPTSGHDPQRTAWDVHCVAYTDDGRSAFARVTARVFRGDSERELRIEETFAYKIDEDGLISVIEVFWRDPRGLPSSD